MPIEVKPVSISTVIPVYSGKEYLEKLADALASVREEWQKNGLPLRLVEAIFVNDSAIDTSAEVLQSLKEKFDWIHVLTLSKNFGQHSATCAGILHACGDWIFTIDEDLQHDPKYFIDLLRLAVTKGYDIVYAKPQEAVHKSFWRDKGSIIYKKLFSVITANPHIPLFNSYRLIRGPVAQAVASVCSHETYFDMALCWFTNEIGSIALPLHDRRFEIKKKSGYTLRKLLSHARRMTISSSAKVLRLGAMIGVLATIASIIGWIIILVQKLIAPETIQVRGWTSTFLVLVFFGGLISFLLGVILEYITNILLHIHGKPSFFVVDRSSDTLIRTLLENGK
jgi:polyisoprenyl-phosphate glycosyltransferase